MKLKELMDKMVVDTYKELGDKEAVAKKLGISRATVYRVLKRAGVK